MIRNLVLVGGAATVAVAASVVYVYVLPDEPPQLLSPAPPRPPFDDRAQAAADNATDLKFDGLYDSGRQWSRVADAPIDMRRDASGHVWFSSPGTYTTASFQQSAERAIAKHSPVLHGGHVLLVDRVGRTWCLPDAKTGTLLCYDGRRWLEPHPAADPKQASESSSFAEVAIDDGAGNAYFFSYPTTHGPATLHRFSRDGVWSRIPFPTSEKFTSQPLLARQIGGRVAVYMPGALPQGNGMSVVLAKAAMQVMPHFSLSNSNAAFVCDGQAMTAYEAKVHAWEKGKVNQVLPLPDGSFLTFFKGSDRVTLGWPEGLTDGVRVEADRLIGKLDAPDPAEREDARTALTRMGPTAQTAVDAAIASPRNQGPQRQVTLADVKAQLDAAASADKHPDAVLYGGRYRLSELVQVARSFDDSVLMFAMSAEDHQTGRTLGPSLIRIGTDGVWTVKPLPDMSAFATLPSKIDSATEDARGDLWLGPDAEALLDPKSMTLSPCLPPATDIGPVRECDVDGRVFFRHDNDLFVFDTRVPDAPPALPTRTFAAKGIVRSPGAKTAWFVGDGPTRVDADGSLRPLPFPGEMVPVTVQPLGDTAVIATMAGTRPGRLPDHYPFLYDGHDWHDPEGPGGVSGIVHGWAPWLPAAAARDFAPFETRDDLLRLGSDRGHGAWSEVSVSAETDSREFRMTLPTTLLEHFDGQNWSPVWPLFAEPAKDGDDDKSPAPGTGCVAFGTVDDGHLLLVRDARGKLWGVSDDGDGLNRHPVPGSEEFPSEATAFRPGGGGLWWWTDTSGNGPKPPGTVPPAPTIATYRDGRIVAMPLTGRPISVDAKGRVWSVDGHRLVVRTDATTAAGVDVDVGVGVGVGDFDGPDDHARVVDGPDGRQWLLHVGGLTEVKANGATLTLGRTWPWNAPMNHFDPAFVDTAGGLWLGGVGGRIGRVTLP